MSYLVQLRTRHTKVVGSGDAVAASFSAIRELNVDREKRLVTGIVTSNAVDLTDEIVVPTGCDRGYMDQIKVVLVGHDHAMPVGVMRNMKITPKNIRVQTYIARTPLGEDTLTAIQEGLLPAHSIGFRTMNFGPLTREEEEEYGEKAFGIHREWLMLEYSFVSQPCNPEAMIDEKGLFNAVSSGMIHRASAVVFGLSDTPARKWWPTTEVVVDV
jgi:HK97 family phage prohead protease